MKLNQNYRTTRVKGMTLIELTVVILVLLSLVSLLFIGARAYKRGSDRAGCVMNIRNAQQSSRSYANFNRLEAGASYDFEADCIGSGNFLELPPVCPGRGVYAFLATIPETGSLAMTCSLAPIDDHQPDFYESW